MWVIDKLALRVGNEKGEDEADTVCFFFFQHDFFEKLSLNKTIFNELGWLLFIAC